MSALLTGLLTAVALLASIPLYAEATQNRLLQGALTDVDDPLPPFAFIWRYIGAWNGDIDVAAYQPIDTYLTEQAPGVIDLPLALDVRHVRTPQLRLFPDAGSAAFVPDEPLLFTAIGALSGLEQRITLLEGAFPAPTADAGPTPVLVSAALADRLGLQLDETYVLFAPGGDATQIRVRIVGVWRAQNAAEPYWFFRPTAFEQILLTSEAVFFDAVAPELETPIAQAVWYQVFDGGRVRTQTVAPLTEGIRAVEARANALLDQTTLERSPLPALATYGTAARVLTTVLTAFSVPVIGLVLYFITLIAGMVVQRSQGELAVLRSRGMTRGQIVGLFALEGVLLGAVGLGAGLLLAMGLAEVMSRTQSFLRLTAADATPLAIVLSPTAVAYGAIGVGLVLLALVVPAFGASRNTVVTFRWQRARTLRAPTWQRYGLDLLLLVPAAYGWYQLEQQGTVAFIDAGDDPFSNPLLFLVPALFCFALSLVAVRLFPLLMAGLMWLAERLPDLVALITLRQLARSAALYTGPLLLISLTLSLATFTASMALTLDAHLVDAVYYGVGADVNLVELGESTEEQAQQTLPGQEPAPAAGTDGGPRFLFLPVETHLTVDGILQAARVGDYTATSNIGGRQQQGRLLGVDRLSFPAVATFRPDFASGESLGSLMNRLAADEDNLLVDRAFLERHALAVGDPLRLSVEAAGDFADLTFTVAGAFDLFPTYYPTDGPLFVANLSTVHDGLGGTYPYNVWLATDGRALPSLIEDVRALGITVVSGRDARADIDAAQLAPERQGFFGLLSVGFVAAALLTVLGYLVFAVVTFRRRFIELGMLRAVGLSVGQMGRFLAGEQALVIGTGMGLGTLIGVAASILFIPFLQVGTGRTAQVPPFEVRLAWQQIGEIYAVFGVMFVFAVALLLLLLVRMRLFEAIKLGETI